MKLRLGIMKQLWNTEILPRQGGPCDPMIQVDHGDDLEKETATNLNMKLSLENGKNVSNKPSLYDGALKENFRKNRK